MFLDIGSSCSHVSCEFVIVKPNCVVNEMRCGRICDCKTYLCSDLCCE
jgi:hypothetical protein